MNPMLLDALPEDGMNTPGWRGGGVVNVEFEGGGSEGDPGLLIFPWDEIFFFR